jgi:ABC-type bacteriocin/lantibiotic exporter with double-glycine peptidase domain
VVKILNCAGTIRAYENTLTDLSKNDTSLSAIVHESKTINTIECKDVSFTFREQTILKHFNCYLQKGDFIGINSISGKGKTTLIHLLLGFEKCNSGQILFNDTPADAITAARYWNQIAYVKQQTFLIHDTVLTNITLTNTTIDNEQLGYAIAASGLTEIIAQYPEGLDKIITENGKNISGGQRQRIAIARALYKNANLLIMDEPFNELDNNSENKLLLHLQELSQSGKMIILITHNKKSLLFCNKIISLDDQ